MTFLGFRVRASTSFPRSRRARASVLDSLVLQLSMAAPPPLCGPIILHRRRLPQNQKNHLLQYDGHRLLQACTIGGLRAVPTNRVLMATGIQIQGERVMIYTLLERQYQLLGQARKYRSTRRIMIPKSSSRSRP